MRKDTNRDEELLKRIHEIQLEMLTMFDKVCEKLGLRYSISSGTLLGAVRHKGFIPWDDDIDVAMCREDYDKFIKIANKHMPKGYFLQHYSTEKNCPFVFAKIRNSNTTWIEEGMESLKINHGFGMDIFPIDKISDDPKFLKKYKTRDQLYAKLKTCRDFHSIKICNRFYKKIIGILLMPLSRMIGLKKLNQKQDNWDKHFGGDYTTADFLQKNRIVPYSIFEEYEKIEFEGQKFWTIKERDTYLKAAYGSNYMQLPPIEKRHIHFAKIIDCDRPYTFYTQDKKTKGDKLCKH